jgi:hypothetical protein
LSVRKIRKTNVEDLVVGPRTLLSPLME